MKYVKKTIAVNLLWQLFERFGAEIITFIASIILARVLDKEVYGLVAIATVFITILSIIVDGGFCSALIQKEDPTEKDYSSVFYLNLVTSLLIYVLLFFLAVPIANYFKNELLTWIIRIMSLSFIFNAFKNASKAYSSKTMKFKNYFISTVAGTIVGSGVAIYLAIKGFGVLALVANFTINALVSSITLFIITKWKPKAIFSISSIKELFKFGWKILVSSTFETVVTQGRSFVIGKKYTNEDLANYTKGQSFPSMVGSNVSQSLVGILYPSISSVQKSKENVHKTLRISTSLISYLVLPMMVGLMIVAEPLVKILLTDKWIEAVPYIEIFSIYFLFDCLASPTLSSLKGVGMSGRLMILQIVKKTIDLGLLIALMNFGVIYIALASIITSLIFFIVHMFINKHYFNYTISEQISDIFPSLVSTILMVGLTQAVVVIPVPYYVTFIIQIIIGIVSYFFINRLLKNPTNKVFVDGIKSIKR